MPIRIYSLAKQLKLDSKLLVDICTKAGVTGKGSALASLTDEEMATVTAFINAGKAARLGAPAAPVGRSETSAPSPVRREDYIAPAGTAGLSKVRVLPPSKHDRPPLLPKKPAEPPAPSPPSRRPLLPRPFPLLPPWRPRRRSRQNPPRKLNESGKRNWKGNAGASEGENESGTRARSGAGTRKGADQGPRKGKGGGTRARAGDQAGAAAHRQAAAAAEIDRAGPAEARHQAPPRCHPCRQSGHKTALRAHPQARAEADRRRGGQGVIPQGLAAGAGPAAAQRNSGFRPRAPPPRRPSGRPGGGGRRGAVTLGGREQRQLKRKKAASAKRRKTEEGEEESSVSTRGAHAHPPDRNQHRRPATREHHRRIALHGPQFLRGPGSARPHDPGQAAGAGNDEQHRRQARGGNGRTAGRRVRRPGHLPPCRQPRAAGNAIVARPRRAGKARAASADRHLPGPRRPRQDLAAGPNHRHRRGRARKGGHHPAHPRLPRREGRPRNRLRRYAGPRGLHRDARPRGQRHRHRRAGGRGRGRSDAADRGGHQPRPRRRRPDRRRPEQDRPAGRQPAASLRAVGRQRSAARASGAAIPKSSRPAP